MRWLLVQLRCHLRLLSMHWLLLLVLLRVRLHRLRLVLMLRGHL